jgi:hypothetical protein
MSTGAPLQVFVQGVGVLGPGLPDWAAARALLPSPRDWAPLPVELPPPARLPAAERRRSGGVVKLSLAVAEQAIAMAGADPAELATVFSSSSGDGANCDALCAALAQPERAMSPTRFTNSVHNTSAGYWHIACASRAPSTSLCAYDTHFGAGLLEAAAQCLAWQRPLLLVSVDVPYPEPLLAKRPLAGSFGVALLLSPSPGGRALQLAVGPGDANGCAYAGLETLRGGIPAARCLPLLEALAGGGPASVAIGLADGLVLRLHIAP